MKVGVLQQFLRSLVPALEAAGDGKTAGEVRNSLAALDPFEPLDVSEFGAFLVRANEYRADGAVTIPGPGEQQVESLAKLLTRLNQATEGIPSLQQEIAAAVQNLAALAGLKGTLKPEPKWAEAQASKARVAPHRKALLELAARIISPDAYEEPIVQEGMARLAEQLDPASLKLLAAEFEVKTTAKSQSAKVIGDLLAKLSGQQPPKIKAKAKSASVDPAVVEEHARRLMALIERSINPDAVNDSDVAAELARLKTLSPPTLFEVVVRSGMNEARSSESKSALLKRVQAELTAARRARERAEV